MRLEFLFDKEFRYSEPISMMFPYGGRQGQGYGGGEGTIQGDILRGTFTWSNWPRMREDGEVEPDVTGIIHTDDDAKILFRIGGYSLLKEDRSGRTVIGDALYSTDDERYSWLNTAFVVQEGAADFTTGVVSARFYRCVPEINAVDS